MLCSLWLFSPTKAVNKANNISLVYATNIYAHKQTPNIHPNSFTHNVYSVVIYQRLLISLHTHVHITSACHNSLHTIRRRTSCYFPHSADKYSSGCYKHFCVIRGQSVHLWCYRVVAVGHYHHQRHHHCICCYYLPVSL